MIGGLRFLPSCGLSLRQASRRLWCGWQISVRIPFSVINKVRASTPHPKGVLDARNFLALNKVTIEITGDHNIYLKAPG